MSIWLLHGGNKNPERNGWLALPLGDLPDLTAIGSLSQCRQLLQKIAPDDPPETLAGRASRLWEKLTAIQQENLIALPLPQVGQVMIAEITGPYHYVADAAIDERHRCNVQWHRPLPLRKFRGFKQVMEPSSDGTFQEVTEVGLRNLLRSSLAVSYNRFSGLAWIAGLLLALQVANMVIGLIRGN